LPAYTLRGYLLVWTAYNADDLPVGTGKRLLPDLPPGSVREESIDWPTFPSLRRVRVSVYRPTGYLVLETSWTAKR